MSDPQPSDPEPDTLLIWTYGRCWWYFTRWLTKGMNWQQTYL